MVGLVFEAEPPGSARTLSTPLQTSGERGEGVNPAYGPWGFGDSLPEQKLLQSKMYL